MTEIEVANFLDGLSARYPNFRIEDKVRTRQAWYADLKNYSSQQVLEAFSIYRSENTTGFAPSIDQLLYYMHTVHDMNQLSATEAWNLVSQAVRDAGYHAQEQFDKLPPLVKKVVSSPAQLHNWSQTDFLVLEGTIAKQFQISYEIEAKRERTAVRLPENIKAQIGANTSNTRTWEALPVFTAPEEIVTDADKDYVSRLKGLLNASE